MNNAVEWYSEFAAVIRCGRCSGGPECNVLRDELENIPQPGYVGAEYKRSRLLLVGQNPGLPKSMGLRDQPYTAALRQLGSALTTGAYDSLQQVLEGFVSQWPIHRRYFPLSECGLGLRDIAYCNVVRCRTANDQRPYRSVATTCMNEHFTRWLKLLAPKAVVFLGKWAHDQASEIVDGFDIPNTFINRQRSLSSIERAKNRTEVISLVLRH
ncbi:MAG: uracil-DNA glycosylase family protein, partial [Bryobacteraceae bacterium]